MITVLSVAQMRKIDGMAIAGNHEIGYAYMNKAAKGLYDIARELAPDPKAGDISVFCGKGNNGGDGFSVASLLVEAGYSVMCYALCQPETLQGEAKMAFDHYDSIKGNFMVLDDVADLVSIDKCSLIIDAVLGTGIKGDPHGISAEVIQAINDSGVRVLAADTPSGLDNDQALPMNPCIHAHTTVAMGFPKIGSFFFPGRSVVGRLHICDLGYPKDLIDMQSNKTFYPELPDFKELLPPRKPDGSKFDHGVAMMICGSRGMAGAAVLASQAAMRTGCGMVHCFSPKGILQTLAGKLTEVVLHGIDESPLGTPGFSSLDFLLEKSKQFQAVCIGPGISHEEETSRLVRNFIAWCPTSCVLDADGLNAFKGKVQELKNHASPLVITPHKEEWARLFGPLPKEPLEVVEIVRKTAKEFGLTVLYKGFPTIVAVPQGDVFLLPYGNSGMATAGSGDVLSGTIVSLIAQGVSVPYAAMLGAYIHAKSGELASEELTEYSVIASDIVGNISKAMRVLTKKSSRCY